MLIPILYLKGISTGDFEEALAALLGKDAPGLSASTLEGARMLSGAQTHMADCGNDSLRFRRKIGLAIFIMTIDA